MSVCVCVSVCVCIPCLSPADADGFVKVLADKGTDRLLGAHIIGTVSGRARQGRGWG